MAAALDSINDLFSLDEKISTLEAERTVLAEQLQNARDAMNQGLDPVVQEIAQDITSGIDSAADIDMFEKKYGPLRVLNQLKLLVENQEREAIVTQVSEAVDNLLETEDIPLEALKTVSLQLKQLQPIQDVLTIIETFNKRILTGKIQQQMQEFDKFLLDTRWDTQYFVSTSADVLDKLKKGSTSLFQLSQLYVSEQVSYKNFQCLANNFKIRFTYHFHNDSSVTSVESYFKFLNDYLLENLYKCINIFQDEPNGISKELVHEEFINHVLQPIREKVQSSLPGLTSKNLIILVSQILSTDRNLTKSFQYKGLGLSSLVTSNIWNTWVKYEVEIASQQFSAITNDSSQLVSSGMDFIKLLEKTHARLDLFNRLEYDSIWKYKLIVCSRTFVDLSQSFLEYVLAADSLKENRTKSEELEQTIYKLHTISIVYKKLKSLHMQRIFVDLTDFVNKKEGSAYNSIFQHVLQEYAVTMDKDIIPSIVHRVQKMLKQSLSNYFKISMWSPPEEDEEKALLFPTVELTNSIKILNKNIQSLQSLSVLPHSLLSIKHELLNIIVNYFIQSILKLNKFNLNGINQLKVDYEAMKKAINLPPHFRNVQDCKFQELLTVLQLKYRPQDQIAWDKFWHTAYVKQRQFHSLRELLTLQWLDDSELQDALYRLAFGSVV